jgi:murein DD-endopeptidase MepM/ murein hydrolase activator NlpD
VEGNHFYIQHGSDLVLYAHMQPGSLNPDLLVNNQTVTAGTFLVLAGNSGNSTNPHLHIHAIKGTAPWQGPPRPILFKDINVIDRSVLSPPSFSGPWVSVNGAALPSVESAIWPAATEPWPHYFIDVSSYLSIDPLALILDPRIYIKLHLPDPGPIETLFEAVRHRARAATPAERELLLERVDAWRARLNSIQKELRRERR